MSLDKLVQHADDPATPPDARFHLNKEIFNQIVTGLSFPDSDELSYDLNFLFTDGSTGFNKAQRADGGGWDYQPVAVPKRVKPGTRGYQRDYTSVLMVNEFGIISRAGDRSRWLERTNGFDFLKAVVGHVDVIKAVILTRQRQILPFLRPSRRDQPLGYRFVRVDDEKLTADDKQTVTRVEGILLNSGDLVGIEREKKQRDLLSTFVGKLLWDTLSYDACPIEVIAKNNGRLSGWIAVAGDTVRLCTEHGYEGDDAIRGSQVIDGVPEAAYTYENLVYRVRNPRTDLYAGGYGYAEPEMVIRALTAYLNAVTYNAAGLDRNSIPRDQAPQSVRTISEALVRAPQSVRATSETLDGALQSARTTSEALDQALQSLRTTSETLDRALHRVQSTSEALERALHSVQSVSEALERMLHRVQSTSEALERALHSVQSVSEALERTLHSVQSTSEALERALHGVQCTSEALERALHSVQSTSEALERALHSVQSTSEALERALQHVPTVFRAHRSPCAP